METESFPSSSWEDPQWDDPVFGSDAKRIEISGNSTPVFKGSNSRKSSRETPPDLDNDAKSNSIELTIKPTKPQENITKETFETPKVPKNQRFPSPIKSNEVFKLDNFQTPKSNKFSQISTPKSESMFRSDRQFLGQKSSPFSKKAVESILRNVFDTPNVNEIDNMLTFTPNKTKTYQPPKIGCFTPQQNCIETHLCRSPADHFKLHLQASPFHSPIQRTSRFEEILRENETNLFLKTERIPINFTQIENTKDEIIGQSKETSNEKTKLDTQLPTFSQLIQSNEHLFELLNQLPVEDQNTKENSIESEQIPIDALKINNNESDVVEDNHSNEKLDESNSSILRSFGYLGSASNNNLKTVQPKDGAIEAINAEIDIQKHHHKKKTSNKQLEIQPMYTVQCDAKRRTKYIVEKGEIYLKVNEKETLFRKGGVFELVKGKQVTLINKSSESVIISRVQQ